MKFLGVWGIVFMHSVLRRFFTRFFCLFRGIRSRVVIDIAKPDSHNKVVDFRRIKTGRSCIFAAIHLAFFWISGLAIGSYAGMHASVTYLRTLSAAAGSDLTISGLAISVFLPFVICIFAAHNGKKWLLFLIAFAKALCVSYCSAALNCAFGSAGWLIRILFQFSDLATLGFFCWFCIRCMTNDLQKADYYICSAAYILVGLFDYCIVSPFLVTLIDI